MKRPDSDGGFAEYCDGSGFEVGFDCREVVDDQLCLLDGGPAGRASYQDE